MLEKKFKLDATVSSYATRADKSIAALKPLYFNLEERNTEHFLNFIVEIAKYVRYYDLNNIESGDWQSFFSSHELFILLKISNWNIEVLKNEWKEIVKFLDNTMSPAIQKQKCVDFLGTIENIFNQHKSLLDTINNNTTKENAIRCIPSIEQNLESIKTTIQQTSAVIDLVENPYFEKSINKLFGLLQNWVSVNKYNVDPIISSNKHHPHIALLLTFLDLLKYAQQALNTFTARHLDFYYKNLLNFNKPSFTSDSVYLQIEPKTDRILIPKHTQFLADKDTKGQQKFYITTIDQTVNSDRIEKVYVQHATANGVIQNDILPLLNNYVPIKPFTNSIHNDLHTLAIASKLFWLQSGIRTITFTIHTNEGIYKQPISIKLSAKSKWLTFEHIYPNTNGEYTININAQEEAIIGYSEKIHKDIAIPENLPIALITLNKYQPIVTINKINVSINVEELQNFSIISEHGIIDNDKPFLPFGPTPTHKNYVNIFIPEIFQKVNAEGIIKVAFDNSTFKNYQIQVVHNNNKTTIEKNFNSLNTLDTTKPLSDNYKVSYLQLSLNDTKYENQKYLESIIKNATDSTPILYLPKINNLTLGYNVNETIQSNNSKYDTKCYKLFTLGYEKVTSFPIKLEQPDFTVGNIIIGIQQTFQNNNVSLYFHLQPNGINPIHDHSKVTFSYLNNNIWSAFDTAAIADGTNSLNNSGVIQLHLPNNLNLKNNTILDPKNIWIKLEIEQKENAHNIIGIHTQMILAILDTSNNYVFDNHTAAFTIKKSLDYNLGIKKITQHYPSFGGKVIPTDEAFYNQISQLLKHKNRAITSWDIESIILDNIDEVDSVKILSHYKKENDIDCNLSAGYITIVPIAKANKEQPLSWQPLINKETQHKIIKLISQFASPHANIRLLLPQLEQLKVTCKIAIKESHKFSDTAIITSQVNDAINTLLSPWAYTEEPIKFFDFISISTIIHKIESIISVDYLIDMKVTHITKDIWGNDKIEKITNESVRANTPYSIFIPVDNHEIQIIT